MGPPFGLYPLKKKSVDQIVGALARLRAVDIVDPKERKERGLNEPSFRLSLILGGREEKALIGSHPDPLEDGYMMVAGGDGMIFRVSRHTFQLPASPAFLSPSR